MQYNIEKMKKDLKNSLSEYRFLHSVRVAEEAKKLAIAYNVDSNEAYVAGLLHDIAKEFTKEENNYYIKKYHLPPFCQDKDYQKILHSDIGAIYAKEKYNISDNIASAIRNHTLGDVEMKLLDKIVFIADKTEEGKQFEGINQERELAYKDIDKAMALCIENYHKKLIKENKKIHPRSLEVLKNLDTMIAKK